MKIKSKIVSRIVILAVVSICFCLTGCKGKVSTNSNINNDTTSKVTETPTVTIAAPAESTATPAPMKSTAGLQVIKSFTYKQNANVLEFYNPDYGLTAGHLGEIHYTVDQGNTWPAAQNITADIWH